MKNIPSSVEDSDEGLGLNNDAKELEALSEFPWGSVLSLSYGNDFSFSCK